MGDIFDTIFGGGFGGRGSSGRGPQRGADIKTNIDLSFEEAAFGVEREITINKNVSCDACEGTGSKSRACAKCTACGGTGQVQVKSNTPFGVFMNVKTCDKCGGSGKTITDPCPECQGRGKVRKSVKTRVKIPAGIDNGQAVSLQGMGEPGSKGGPPGNLLVSVRVRPHRTLKRDGFDIYSDVGISFVQAAMGDEILVDTIDGKVELKIPAGTQPGASFKMRGKGIPKLQSSGRGDQYVRVNVQVPKNLTEKQKELLKQFAETLGESASGKGGGNPSGEEKRSFFGRKK